MHPYTFIALDYARERAMEADRARLIELAHAGTPHRGLVASLRARFTRRDRTVASARPARA